MSDRSKARGPYVPPHLRKKNDAEASPTKSEDHNDASETQSTTPKRNNEEKTTPIKSKETVLATNTTPTKATPSPNVTPTRVAISLPPSSVITPEKTPTPSPAKSDSRNTTPISGSILSTKSPSKEWGYDDSLEESFNKLKIQEATPTKHSPKTIASPKTPESPYTPTPIDEHIPRDVMKSLSYAVEISNIPPDMNTEDLDEWLESYQEEGYKLQWVNDAYCLAIFRSVNTARHALRTLTHPDFIMKEFSQSSEESKRFMLKREKLDYLLPAAPRPARTAVVARRLIAGALQMPQIQRTPEHKAQEKDLRRQREEKRKQNQEKDAE